MKIKDIISEGFWSSFGKALLPSALQKVADIKDPQAEPSQTDLALKAQRMFGDNPESPMKGFMGWVDPSQVSVLSTIADQKKQRDDRIKAELEKAKQATKATNISKDKQTKGNKNRLKNIMTGASSSDNTATAASIPAGQRIKVTNPQGNATFYKYPGGKWTDEFGTLMPQSSHAALDQFADSGGRMEQIPTATKTAYQGRGGRRGR